MLIANSFTFTQQCEGGEWFHYTCVGLTPETRFKGKWFCPTCRNLQWGFSYVGKMHTSNNYFISKSLLQFMFLYSIVDFKTLYVVPFCTVFPIVHFKTLLVVPLVQSFLIAKKFPTIWQLTVRINSKFLWFFTSSISICIYCVGTISALTKLPTA